MKIRLLSKLSLPLVLAFPTVAFAGLDIEINLPSETKKGGWSYAQSNSSQTNSQQLGAYVANITDGGLSVFDDVLVFCAELNQSFTPGSAYGVKNDQVKNVNKGISDAQVGQLGYLFDQFYISTDYSAWYDADNNDWRNIYAFQYAVWEITHDSDLDVASFGETGINWLFGFIPMQYEKGFQMHNPDTALEHQTRNLAQAWLTDVEENWENSEISGELIALTSSKKQDQLFYIKSTVAVPEPSALLFLGTSASIGLIVLRRRRNAAV